MELVKYSACGLNSVDENATETCPVRTEEIGPIPSSNEDGGAGVLHLNAGYHKTFHPSPIDHLNRNPRDHPGSKVRVAADDGRV